MKRMALAGIVALATILLAGMVSGLLVQSVHNSNNSNTDWTQYILDCSYGNSYGGYRCNWYSATGIYACCDDNVAVLWTGDGMVEFDIPITEIEFGLYRLIVVGGIYNFDTNSMSTTPIPISIELGLTTKVVYYDQDSYPISQGPPAQDHTNPGNCVNPLPIDFGLIYFDRTEFNTHNIQFFNNAPIGGPNLAWVLDEVILTPA